MLSYTKKIHALLLSLSLLVIISMLCEESSTRHALMDNKRMTAAIGQNPAPDVGMLGSGTPTADTLLTAALKENPIMPGCNCVLPEELDKKECAQRKGEVKFSTPKSGTKIECADEQNVQYSLEGANVILKDCSKESKNERKTLNKCYVLLKEIKVAAGIQQGGVIDGVGGGGNEGAVGSTHQQNLPKPNISEGVVANNNLPGEGVAEINQPAPVPQPEPAPAPDVGAPPAPTPAPQPVPGVGAAPPQTGASAPSAGQTGSSLPAPAGSDYIAPSNSQWSNQNTWNSDNPNALANSQGTNPYVNNYGGSPATTPQSSFGQMISNFFNPSHVPPPVQQVPLHEGRDFREQGGQQGYKPSAYSHLAQNDYSDPTAGTQPTFFNNLYDMLTSYDRYTPREEQNLADTLNENAGAEGAGGYGGITYQSDEFGEVIAYGVSQEQLRGILSDIAGHEVSMQTGNLPSVAVGADGELSVTLGSPASPEATQGDPSTGSGQAAATPSWLRDLVLSGGSAVADSSGRYGYVTSPDNKTVDIYEEEEGQFVTLQSDEEGNINIGLTNKEGEIVFLPRGGLLDSEAQWSEFTKAFVDIAGRAPTQTIDTHKIPVTLTPFDIVVREIYGDEALELGISFAEDSAEYTVGKNGRIIPVVVIDAAMEVVKEKAGVTELQEYIEENSDGKMQITTSGSSFRIGAGVELTAVRIMPVPQQMLVLARLKGEMEVRGHENIRAAIHTAIFNTYDSTAKKVAGVTAFTVRIDENGNRVGSTKVTFSMKTLIAGMFATFAGAADSSTLANNALTRFFGSLFSSTPSGALQEGNVYKINTGEEPTTEPQTFGEAAVKVIGRAIAAPFKLVGKILDGLFK